MWWDEPLFLAPIAHPQRHHGLGDLARISIPESRVHPLLASILAPRVPQIHLETALSCLCYLQSGGLPLKSRKSLKPLLKSRYFTRLKMRPSLSRSRKGLHHHPSGRCLLDEQDLHSTWWGNHPKRPNYYIHWSCKTGVLVPLFFFSYRSEYASNYDLWYTYRSALQLLPLVLANSPPDSYLASIVTNCIFSSFCTAYPQETRKARKYIARYLRRCQSIRATRGRVVMEGMSEMDVDSHPVSMDAKSHGT